ncbi:hypothetical protein ACFQ4Q_11920 [Lysobacter gummosus]|uniref:hypothetical protein n=1 Tax=Lysobacter gummosus TaxID=262324 RepID=UPI00363BFC90
MSLGYFFIVLIIVGIGVQLYGFIWLLVLAFKQNLWWGLGSLFITPVLWVYAILHWRDTKPAALTYFIGFLCTAATAVWLSFPTPAISPCLASAMLRGTIG